MTGNVRAALGIVYATDAVSEPRVKVAARFPDDCHVPIVYPLAVPVASKSPEAERFGGLPALARRRAAVRGAQIGEASRRGGGPRVLQVRVATEMWGQTRPLKTRRTRCVYCS